MLFRSENTMLMKTKAHSSSPCFLPYFSIKPFLWAGISCVIIESVSFPVFAQQQIYSGLSGLSITPAFPSISGGEERFQIDSNLICPTTTVGLGVFGGRGNSFANANAPYADSSSNLTNYGIAAGIRIPLDSYLTEFCKDYAKRRVDFESIRTEDFKRNSLLSLIEQCRWAQQQGVVARSSPGQIQGDDLGLGKFLSFCGNVTFATNNKNQVMEIRLPRIQIRSKDQPKNGRNLSTSQEIRQLSPNPPDSPITNPSPPTPLWNGNTSVEAETKQHSGGPPQSDTSSFSQPNPVLQLQRR